MGGLNVDPPTVRLSAAQNCEGDHTAPLLPCVVLVRLAGGAVEREYAPLKARSVIEAAKRSELVILRGKPPFVRRPTLEAWLATRGRRPPAAPADFAGTYAASVRRAG